MTTYHTRRSPSKATPKTPKKHESSQGQPLQVQKVALQKLGAKNTMKDQKKMGKKTSPNHI